MTFPTDADGTWVNPSSVTLDAGELRRADSAGFAGAGAAFAVLGGIVRHAATALSVSVDGSDVVTVQPGAVVIPGNAVTGTGCYRGGLSTATTGALTARNATNPRIDLVVFRQLDTDVVGTHGAYKQRVEIIAGTPSATPGVPALPSMAVELARITVPATGGGTATVDLTYRTYACGLGGVLPVPTFARLADYSIAGTTWPQARALDTGVLYTRVGSNWVPEPQRGVRTVTPDAADTTKSVTVSFGVTFPVAPVVLVGLASSVTGYNIAYWADTVTTTGFTLNLRRGSTGATDLVWQAGAAS